MSPAARCGAASQVELRSGPRPVWPTGTRRPHAPLSSEAPPFHTTAPAANPHSTDHDFPNVSEESEHESMMVENRNTVQLCCELRKGGWPPKRLPYFFLEAVCSRSGRVEGGCLGVTVTVTTTHNSNIGQLVCHYCFCGPNKPSLDT